MTRASLRISDALALLPRQRHELHRPPRIGEAQIGDSEMRIFVAGGTGAIGRPLIAELLANAY
jgi:FlaA1/EpsC-like NDP-sugar epimerase